MELVFMLEEPSAKNFLDRLLPRVIPEGITFRTIPHQGKSDLQHSLPIKLRSWLNPEVRFIVLQDKDSLNCMDVKAGLIEICRRAGRNDVLVRIACYELEAWYLGDFDAIQSVYPRFNAARVRNRARYRIVDNVVKPSDHLKRLIPEFQKGAASRMIPDHIDIDNNTSSSFRSFIQGVRDICAGA